MTEVTKIACIGAGYVGAPTSAIIAKMCPEIQVAVLDVAESRIAAFNSDELPIYEPGLFEVVKDCRQRNLIFSTDLEKHIKEAQIIFVSVNTPTKKTGIGAGAASDLCNWEAAGRSIAKYSTTRKVVVEKSTVPLKTAAALAKVLEANKCPGAGFDVLSNPEFLAEGTAIADLLKPDRILIGGDPNVSTSSAAIEALTWVYSHWVPRDRILCMDVWSSELSKLAANAFLAQRISSINSIGQLCEVSGADVTQVARAIGMDSRIGSRFLNASIGFGGSCFKKDILNLVYICETFGLHETANYWMDVVRMNEQQKSRFITRIVRAMFNTVRNKKVAVFGFAFKKDTADVRETPALDVCLGLLEEGARIAVYDPRVQREAAFWEAEQQSKSLEKYRDNFEFTKTPHEAVEGADCIAVLTEWDEFKTLDYQAFYKLMRRPAWIFDGRIVLDHAALQKMGFLVRCIGKSLSPTTHAGAESSDLDDEASGVVSLSPLLPTGDSLVVKGADVHFGAKRVAPSHF